MTTSQPTSVDPGFEPFPKDRKKVLNKHWSQCGVSQTWDAWLTRRRMELREEGRKRLDALKGSWEEADQLTGGMVEEGNRLRELVAELREELKVARQEARTEKGEVGRLRKELERAEKGLAKATNGSGMAGQGDDDDLTEEQIEALAAKDEVGFFDEWRWAFDHLLNPSVSVEDAPSAGAWTLRKWGRGARTKFMEMSLKFLGKKAEEDGGDGGGEVDMGGVSDAELAKMIDG